MSLPCRRPCCEGIHLLLKMRPFGWHWPSRGRVLVEFDPNSRLGSFDQFLDLAEALRRTLERPVDLVESSAVHNAYLRAAINRSRELVYGS